MIDENRKGDVSHSILLRDYIRNIKPTDTLPKSALNPVLLGLFGEVGSIMTTAKKLHREKNAYSAYRNAVEEEFGDTFWYFTTLCSRLNIGVDDILSETASAESYRKAVASSDLRDGAISHDSSVEKFPTPDETLLKLGESAAALLNIDQPGEQNRKLLQDFADQYLRVLQAAQLNFTQVLSTNISKTRGRFLSPDVNALPTFDKAFDEEERLPEHFEIKITQRKSGQSYIQWNGVFVGDPLTDNIFEPDGYRFHDVFHFSYAAILHWSPTFRALLKQKRKSDKRIDENEDGGRAIVIEEGLTAWIFSRAKELEYFKNQDRISFDLLKIIQQFVRGYEVEHCPLNLWERAILDGYRVFRQVRDNEGGIVIGDRENRSISYQNIIGE